MTREEVLKKLYQGDKAQDKTNDLPSYLAVLNDDEKEKLNNYIEENIKKPDRSAYQRDKRRSA